MSHPVCLLCGDMFKSASDPEESYAVVDDELYFSEEEKYCYPWFEFDNSGNFICMDCLDERL